MVGLVNENGEFSKAGVLHEVNKRIKEFGSAKKYAEYLGVSPAYLSKALKEFERGGSISGRILSDIGMVKKTVYCRDGGIRNG